MYLAIIDDDPGILTVYKDLLYIYDPDLYDDPTKFIQLNHHQYDCIIIDHRFRDRNWEDVYKKIKGDPWFIVTTTYGKNYYKVEFEDGISDQIDKAEKYANVQIVKKDDYKRLKMAVNLIYEKKDMLNTLKNCML